MTLSPQSPTNMKEKWAGSSVFWQKRGCQLGGHLQLNSKPAMAVRSLQCNNLDPGLWIFLDSVDSRGWRWGTFTVSFLSTTGKVEITQSLWEPEFNSQNLQQNNCQTWWCTPAITVLGRWWTAGHMGFLTCSWTYMLVARRASKGKGGSSQLPTPSINLWLPRDQMYIMNIIHTHSTHT